MRKLLAILFNLLGAGYIASPVDLVPDVLPPITYIDDAGVVLIVLAIDFLLWWLKKKTNKQLP